MLQPRTSLAFAPPAARILAGLLLISTVLAQDLQPAGEDPYPRPTGLLFDEDPEGRHWVLGETYKASCGPDGFCYVPFLGSDAPRNEPVRFQVDAVRVGEGALALTPEAVAGRTGTTLRIDRGPLEVLHRCAMDGIEQVFVLAPRPWDGDVRVSVRVTSASPTVRAGSGLRFQGERGWVDYGAAVAIAPDGRRCAVAEVPTALGFDLVVPAAFARTVEGALVIDPIVSTGTITSNLSREDVSVDAASDGDVGFVVAVERAFSASDHDVFLYRTSTASPAGTQVATVDFTTATWTEPKVAGRDTNDEFLTVATVGAGTARRVFGREVSAIGWTVELPFPISETRESYGADVGADHVTSIFESNRWAVVYEEVYSAGDTDIRARMVGTSGPIGAPFYVASSTGAETSPCISECAGPRGPSSGQRFQIAFLRRGTLGSQIWVRELTHAGTFGLSSMVVPETSVVSLDVSSTGEAVLPSGARPYLLVYGTRALFGNGRFAYAAACAGVTLLGTTSLAELSDQDTTHRHTAPVVSVAGDRWMVAYETAASSTAARSVWLACGDFSTDRFGLALRRERLSSSPADERGLAMVSEYEGTGVPSVGPRALAAWIDPGLGAFTRGAVVAPAPDPVAGHQYCHANDHSGSRSGWLTVIGSTDTLSPKTLRASDLPVGQPCLILVSRSTDFVPGIGGSAGNLCLGGAGFGRFNNLVGTSNGAGVYARNIQPTSLPQPFGYASAQPGETWYFQVWFRDFQGAPTSNLTNGFALAFE